jgi:hypothetical protein
MGWVEPRGEMNGPLLESVGGQWLLCSGRSCSRAAAYWKFNCLICGARQAPSVVNSLSPVNRMICRSFS